jgi:hypothetical protein
MLNARANEEADFRRNDSKKSQANGNGDVEAKG